MHNNRISKSLPTTLYQIPLSQTGALRVRLRDSGKEFSIGTMDACYLDPKGRERGSQDGILGFFFICMILECYLMLDRKFMLC